MRVPSPLMAVPGQPPRGHPPLPNNGAGRRGSAKLVAHSRHRVHMRAFGTQLDPLLFSPTHTICSHRLSTPNPGDVLPLWDPDIPGEVISAGRLGIRIRPNSPAAAKIALVPGGPRAILDVLEEKKMIEMGYTITKPEKPLECIGLFTTTLLTGRLGRTHKGLAFEMTDFQELESPDYPIERSRVHLKYQEL